MSQHSQFVILRKDKENIHHISDLSAAYQFSEWTPGIADCFGKIYEENDIPRYIQSEKFKYVDHFTKEEYDLLFDAEFNSSFMVLLQEFNLSSYSNNTTYEISPEIAKQMLEAVEYLLYEKYDETLEVNVLKNKYIKLFGETYTPYVNYYQKLSNKLDEFLFSYDEEYQTLKYILLRLRTIFDVYVSLSEDTWSGIEYRLLYIAC